MGLVFGGGLKAQRIQAEWSYGIPPRYHRNREKPPKLEVQNPYGGIRITIENTKELKIRGAMGSRAATSDDVTVARTGSLFQVVARPSDNRPIDLEIVAPYGLLVQAATTDGPIEYAGFGRADFQTDSGDILLSFPREATRFELLTVEEPGAFEGKARVRKSSKAWSARDRLPEVRLTYGRLTLKGRRPRSITLQDLPGIPEDSPVKMPWQAEDLLPRLFRQFGNRGLQKRDEQEPDAAEEPIGANFSADVRLVQLDVSVTDKQGRPVAGLRPEDFEVVEDGDAQRLTDVSNLDAPFNLVLLLDCSSSTEQDRPAMQQAVRSFIDVAREGDRVGVYALADTLFQVLSRLTPDHDAARASVEGIERFGGATPLYDAIVLAYAEELARRPRERNALVLLSDGVDNLLYRMNEGTAHSQPWRPENKSRLLDEPSRVSFDRLRKAAEEMNALIYPIVLDPVSGAAKTDPFLSDKAKGWAITVRQRSESLAEATGGKVFHARSLADLDDVYVQVAGELRSIYTLSYRPSNQDFDGEWRRVRVNARGAGVVVRARSGYFAR